MLTVFTPTYNRAYALPHLYESLCRQTDKNFEWLIIDDGSTDETKNLIQSFQKEARINIRFYQKPNGGKHTAINKGVQLAYGELFFIVDSDDLLSSDAVAFLMNQYRWLKDDPKYAGISGVRIYSNGQRIGGRFPYAQIDASAIDIRLKYKIRGDLAEAFKTSILRMFPFPEIPNERFCPEALVWNRIARAGYKLRYLQKGIYVCKYLPDGLTAQITTIRMQSPLASKLYYLELFNDKISVIQKIKAAINFWRFAFCSKTSFNESFKQIGMMSLISCPIGFMFHIKDILIYNR